MARVTRRAHRTRALSAHDCLWLYIIAERHVKFDSDDDRRAKFGMVADQAERWGEHAKAKQLRSYIREFPTREAAAKISPERDALYSSMREWT